MPLRLLLQDQQVRYTPAAQETFIENVARIQTPQGLQQLGTLQLVWKPDTDLLTVHRLQVRRGAQVIDLLADGTRFTVLRRENNLEYSALDGVLTAVVQPGGLQAGDVVDLAYSIRRTDPIRAGTAEGVLGGWVQVPMARVHLRARWPKASGVRWRATDDVKPIEQPDGNDTVLSYQANDITPPAQPTGAPIRFAVTRLVEFSSFKSWREVSARLAPLYTRAGVIAAGSPLKQEVSRIKAAAAEPMARAALALSLVEDSVRYVYLGMNEGGLVPAGADQTWSRRFGDCKAKSVLLVALLKELGIDAQAVAVSTTYGDGLDARLPRIDAFNHVIVATRIGGQVYWLDATRSGDHRLDALTTPNYHWGLPLVAGGSDLIPVVASPLKQPTSDTSVTIDASSGIYAPAPFHVTTVFSGDAAIGTQLAMANLSGDALDRALREWWSKAYDFVTISSVAARFDPEAGTETLSMEGTAHLDWKDGWYTTDGLGVGFEAQFTRPTEANASAPYAVNFPFYVHTSERIRLPTSRRAFTLSGANVDRVVAGVEYRRHVSIEADGSFFGEASSRSVQPEFPAAAAPEAEQALRAMARDTVMLRAPDSYVYTPQDVDARLAHAPTTVNEYIDRGNLLMDRGKLDLAIADYDKALELDPKSDMALANRGMAYLWERKVDEATKDWKAAEELNPKNAVVYRGRGVLLVSKGDAAAAISALSDSLKLAPGNTFTLVWRAHAYWMTRGWAEAIADSTEVLRDTPRVDMYAIRGTAYVYSGQMDLALADAHALIALPSATAANFQSAADIYRAAQMRPEEMQMLTKGLEIAPNVAMYLARARLRPVNDYAGRLEDIDAALKLDAGNLAALSARAEVEYRSAAYAAAIADATAALKVRSVPTVLVVRAAAYAKSGQPQLATADIHSAKALFGSSAEGLNDFCWELGTHDLALDDALAACEEAVTKAPTAAHIVDSKAFVLLRMGRNAEAIAAYDSALKTNPKLGASLYGRGIAKLHSGDQPGGEADIKAATTIARDVADEFDFYGVKP